MTRISSRWSAVFCPECSNLDYFSNFPRKKPKFCKKCNNINMVIKFEDLDYPAGYRKKYVKRRLILLGITVSGILAVMIPIMMSWFLLGLIPEEKVSLEELLNSPQLLGALFYMLFPLFLSLGVGIGISTYLFYVYDMKPSQIELENYVIEAIRRHLPPNLSDLPEVDETKDRVAISWLKNPEGMKILKIREPQPTIDTCPSCGVTIPFDAKFCTKCGENII